MGPIVPTLPTPTITSIAPERHEPRGRWIARGPIDGNRHQRRAYARAELLLRRDRARVTLATMRKIATSVAGRNVNNAEALVSFSVMTWGVAMQANYGGSRD